METTETTQVDTPAAAPAQPGTDTAQGAPDVGVQDTAPGADAGMVSPAGDAASAAQDTQTIDPETAQATQNLIAGKFKSQDDLVKSYKEAERKIGELSRYKSEAEQLKERMAALERLSKGSDESTPQEQGWLPQWMQHPLSKRPNPLTEQKNHQEWMENVFTPHFVNDPAGTIMHFALPAVEQLREQFLAEFDMRERRRSIEESTGNFFSKPAEWSGGKPVTDALLALPNQEAVMADYRKVLDQGVSPDLAAELVYRRHSTAPMMAETQALKARDRDLQRLATGAPSRGAGAERDGSTPGEGGTFEEMMVSSLKRDGVEIPEDYRPRKVMRLTE